MHLRTGPYEIPSTTLSLSVYDLRGQQVRVTSKRVLPPNGTIAILLYCWQAAAMLDAATGRLPTEEYSQRIWRVEDGLPQSRIQAVSQTMDGYLWIGTGNGLV